VRETLERSRQTRLDITEYENLPQARLHQQLARRRVYLHLTRWTSLGLSLLEAMTLGMPVVVLATTEAIEAVPPDVGAISTDLSRLTAAARQLLHDPDTAREAGVRARAAALGRFGLARFLAEWDVVLKEVTR
jgi:glycosyltransferase involved in cell wall biosynthesis